MVKKVPKGDSDLCTELLIDNPEGGSSKENLILNELFKLPVKESEGLTTVDGDCETFSWWKNNEKVTR